MQSLRLASLCLLLIGTISGSASASVSSADYDSIQAAVDAHPGQMVLVPEGDHEISEPIRITGQGGGLYGYGRIIQTNPERSAVVIEKGRDIRIRDLTITRPEGKQETTQHGILVLESESVVIDSVRVHDNHARGGSIEMRKCLNCTIRDCEIRDYKRIAIDDRTETELYGYAFHAIDGHGLTVFESVGTKITDNRIVEQKLLPTKENKEKYNLGTLTEGKLPTKPGRLGEGAVKSGYVSNWHQGSAMIVSSPKTTRLTLIRGNYIENCAQGIDMHSDFLVCTENIIDHCMIGLKGTHGCRHLIWTENIIRCADLWGILLNPGALSHFPSEANDQNPEPLPANVDAGTIIAHNIVTDYGFGHEYWNWGGGREDLGSSYPIALYEGQLDENPPLNHILIDGNIVYDTGKDKILEDGKPVDVPPRYRYAVYVGPWGGEPGPTFPQNLHFTNNILHPGKDGVSTIELKP